MRNIWIIFWLTALHAYAHTNKIGVHTKHFTTIEFPENIVDLEVGSPAYAAKIKGKYLLLKAKQRDAPITSLFARYGEDKKGYTAEIYADEQAPMVIAVETDKTNGESEPTQRQETAKKVQFNPLQEYYSIGLKKQGLNFVLTNLLHKENVIYLRVFIDNENAIPCRVSQPTFEYITSLKSFLFFTKEQRRVIDPIESTQLTEIPAHKGAYFVFAVPACASADELAISLSMQEGGDNYTISIPRKILAGR